jgi:hypothetical protein
VTEPKNPNDDREFEGIGGDGVSTCQVEAMPPDQITAIVRAAILAEIDADALERTRERERADIALLRAWVPELWGEP